MHHGIRFHRFCKMLITAIPELYIRNENSLHTFFLLRDGYRTLARDHGGKEEIPQASLNPSYTPMQKLQVLCLISPVNIRFWHNLLLATAFLFPVYIIFSAVVPTAAQLSDPPFPI